MSDLSSGAGSLGSRVYRAAKRLVPEAARETIRRLSGQRYVRAARAAAQPELSVVVPVYNVAAYLPECLDSALGQTLWNLEVICVDDGSTDDCLDILRSYERKDPRIRVLSQTNSGQGIARNLGVTHARGTYLAFLDADDVVPQQAYEYLAESLKRTGSDFAIGAARRFANRRFMPVAWNRVVHRSDRLGTTIDEFPEAMQDIICANRMFRRDFWVDKVGGFRGHIAYEDHVPMLAAYVRANRFDVLSGVTYHWRVRENNTSTGQKKASLENLLDRIAVKEEAHELLEREASRSVYDTWVARTLDVDFPAFISSGISASELYQNLLAATYRTFLGRASDSALKQVRHFQKLRAWLVSEARWEDLLEPIESYRYLHGQVPATQVKDGRILAVTPSDTTILDGAPDWTRELATFETAMEAAMQRVRWTDAHSLRLQGWAMIRGVDASIDPPELKAWLEDTDTGTRLPLEVEHEASPVATRWAANPSTCYDQAGFGITVDTAAIVAASAPGSSLWALRLEITVQGVTRSGACHGLIAESSAAWPETRSHASDGRVLLVGARHDPRHGYVVAVEEIPVIASRLTVDGRRVGGRLEPTQARAELRSSSSRKPVPVKLTSNGFTVTVPPGRAEEGEVGAHWQLVCFLSSGEEVLPQWPAGPESVGERGIGHVQWHADAARRVALAADRPLLELCDVALTDKHIVTTVTGLGLERGLLTASRLGNDSLTLRLDRAEATDNGTVLSFAKSVSVFGGPELPATSGDYSLGVRLADGRQLVAKPGRALLDRLPMEWDDPAFHLTVSPDDDARFTISAPLPVAAKSLFGQRSMQRDYRSRSVTPRDAVLFQCYRGEFATDSQRAIDDGLRLSRPDLVRYWGVKDRATAVPQGAVPLLIGSQEWYDALAEASYLCNNIDFDAFFLKRPHQRYLQTFHGYPFKSMGRGFWAGKGYSQSRMAIEFARRNREWDTILVPSEFCAEYYRSEYDYTGEILSVGYPRTDFIVSADRAATRAQLLSRLGVAHDKTVVLYAPTFRDNLTTRTYAAKLFDELDLHTLSEALGDDVVVLLRGHNNNQRELERVLATPGVLDVTDYPEINELTVAADVAILDYSSLRFDWALTGKPMLFFVPDLADYFGNRPPLFSYRDSAPGPLLSATEEVVDALRDLESVQRQYTPEIARFNARYNDLHDGRATARVIEAFFT